MIRNYRKEAADFKPEYVEERKQNQEQWPRAKQLTELERCLNDAIYWINNYGTLIDSVHGGLITFKMWDSQIELAKHLLGNKMSCCLKSRQIGASLLAGHLALWFAIFKKNQKIFVISENELKAREFFDDNIMKVYDWLPTWMAPKYLGRTRRILEFGEEISDSAGKKVIRGNRSIVKVYATTADAVRGGSPNLVIIDEAGAIRNIDEMWSALFGSTTRTRGQVWFIGTAKKLGTREGKFFYNMYFQRERRFNQIAPIFMSRYSDPSWSKEREESQKELMGRDFRQEHPATAEEAFMASTGSFFDPQALERKIQQLSQNAPEFVNGVYLWNGQGEESDIEARPYA